MTYEGTHRPLTAYSKALTAAGLVIETIREPAQDHVGQPTAPFLDLLAVASQLPGLSRLRAMGPAAAQRLPRRWSPVRHQADQGHYHTRDTATTALRFGRAPGATPGLARQVLTDFRAFDRTGLV